LIDTRVADENVGHFCRASGAEWDARRARVCREYYTPLEC
jgi:hypothetical protein